MLDKKLVDIFLGITKKADELIASFIDKQDLTGKVDFASIYAHSHQGFAEFTKQLKSNGSVADIQPTGNYYWVNNPLKTTIGEIKRCRVRVPDSKYRERGYVDFEVNNYKYFKNKYLQKPNFTEITSPKGIDMIELRVPKSDINVYFPNIKF